MTRWVVVIACTVVGGVGGWLLGDTVGAVVGGLIGALLGIAAAVLQVRTVVAVSLVAALAIGAIIGREIVQALCLPQTCVGSEILGATVTALAAVVAVGLVVALVARSFEEYGETAALRRQHDHGVPKVENDNENTGADVSDDADGA